MTVAINLRVKKSKERYFEKLLKAGFESVISKDQPHYVFSSNSGYEGIGFSGFGTEASACLVADCLDGLPPDIPGDEIDELVVKAFLDATQNGAKNLEGYLKSLSLLCSSHRASLSTQQYSCMLFLQSSNFPIWLNGQRVLGCSLKPATKISRDLIAGRLDYFCASIGFDPEVLDSMTAIEVTMRAASGRDAISIADQVLNVIRGAIRIADGTEWRFGYAAKHINRLKPSPFYFARAGEILSEWALVPGVLINTICLPETCPQIVKYFFDRVSENLSPNSSREVLAESLRLISASGDADSVADEFLCLWQALETMSLVEGGDTTRISANIANLWLDGNETILHQLQALAPLRNRLVHSGQYNLERQSTIYLMRNIVYNTAMRFAQLTDELPSRQHMVEFMSMMSTPASSLRIKSEALAVVSSIRQAKTKKG